MVKSDHNIVNVIDKGIYCAVMDAKKAQKKGSSDLNGTDMGHTAVAKQATT